MKLSLCIAVLNEEKFIHYPLDSCIEWVDEVIVVDGGSTDRTVEIARSYGKKVKVFRENNPPMFHINKQKVIDRAIGGWILQLDADESVTTMLKNEILDVINKRTSDSTSEVGRSHSSEVCVAYWIPRKNYFLGRFLTKGGVYPDYTIRLYRNGVARFPCKSVHENVEIINPKSETLNSKQIRNTKIGHLKNDLLHFADPDFGRYLKRWRRYNELDAKLLKDKGEKLGLFNHLIIKPLTTFMSMYVRHKGFMDGWQGFVFAFFSSIRYIDIYMKANNNNDE